MNLRRLVSIIVVLLLLCSVLVPVITVFAPENTEDVSEPTCPETTVTVPTTVPTESIILSEPETVPNNTIPDQETTAPEDIPPDTLPEESMPETTIPDTTLPEEEPPVEIEIPDIITDLNVVLYNNHSTDYNLIDGREYIEDIVFYLRKYAPEGMYISGAAAMAYTEGGSGKRGVYYFTNNCFGIKAYSNWDGYVFARSTCKVYKDYETAVAYGASDFFRAYDSMEESVKDYIKLINSNYYNAALDTDSPAEYLEYILSKGYGEAELYSMWLSLIDLYDLTQYDKVDEDSID